MSNEGAIEVVRWWKERADPDYTDDSVDILTESTNATLNGITGELPETDDIMVRFTAPGEEDGEDVDYTVDISEDLLRQAVEELDEVDRDKLSPE